jgi:hypothetical protein
MDIEELMKETGAVWGQSIDDNDFVIIELAFHVSLLLNPQAAYGYEERYCFYNKELAILSVEEYKKTGEISYWHKWHNKGISIECKSLMFEQGILQKKGNECGKVNWDIDQLKEKYPYLEGFNKCF